MRLTHKIIVLEKVQSLVRRRLSVQVFLGAASDQPIKVQTSLTWISQSGKGIRKRKFPSKNQHCNLLQCNALQCIGEDLLGENTKKKHFVEVFNVCTPVAFVFFGQARQSAVKKTHSRLKEASLRGLLTI